MVARVNGIDRRPPSSGPSGQVFLHCHSELSSARAVTAHNCDTIPEATVKTGAFVPFRNHS